MELGCPSSGGNLTITNSTIELNQAERGAGIFHYGSGGGTLNIVSSAILSNQTFSGGAGTDRGGGLYVYSFTSPYATASIVNSTFSGNDALIGGALFINGSPTVKFVNSTIAFNNARNQSGGIKNASSTAIVELHNTIVAENSADVGNTRNLSGDFRATSSYNLIGLGNDGGLSISLGNQLNVANAGLAAVGSYGGPTKTHALLTTSPAIDMGSNAVALDSDGKPLLFDQRGFDRFVDWDLDLDLIVDIGAVELAVEEMFN